jgi:DNA modification methylase
MSRSDAHRNAIDSQRDIKEAKPSGGRRRANDLSGKEWVQNSISVWRNIQKTKQEIRLGHPAMFPVALAVKLLKCFTTKEQKYVLDPFVGSGTTLIAAMNLGKHGIGIDISQEYVNLTNLRVGKQGELFSTDGTEQRVIRDDAAKLLDHVSKESVDICITSPPYWDILAQKRTADYKDTRDYSPSEGSYGSIRNYQRFLRALQDVFEAVYIALKKGSYCIVNVMDIRKKSKLYPLHSDFAAMMESIGYVYDDLIIWDRQHEYNNLRPLGYPAVFRINRVHEYLLIFQKNR